MLLARVPLTSAFTAQTSDSRQCLANVLVQLPIFSRAGEIAQRFGQVIARAVRSHVYWLGPLVITILVVFVVAAPVIAETVCEKHVIVLYEFLGEGGSRAGQVETANNYLNLLLFGAPETAKPGDDNAFKTETLRGKGLAVPLFGEGDCLTFVTSGIAGAALDSVAHESQSKEEFWGEFARRLIHAASPALAVPGRAEVRQYVRHHILRSETMADSFALPGYSVPALMTQLPDLFSVRTLVVRVSTSFWRQAKSGDADRKLVSAYVKGFLIVLDRALQEFDRYFSVSDRLLEVAVGASGRIKLELLEIAPATRPILTFTNGRVQLEKQPTHGWRIRFPGLRGSGARSEAGRWFVPGTPTLELRDSESQPRRWQVPLSSLREIPFEATRTLEDVWLAPNTIPLSIGRCFVSLRWPVRYSVPGYYGLTLATALEIPPALADIRFASTGWAWSSNALLFLIVLLGSVVAGLMARRLLLRDLQWTVSGVPEWSPPADVTGNTARERNRKGRVYWRVTRSFALTEVYGRLHITGSSDRFTLWAPEITAKLVLGERDSRLSGVRLKIQFPRGAYHEPGIEVRLGRLQPGRSLEVGLVFLLAEVREAGTYPNLATLDFDVRFTDDRGQTRTFAGGLSVEEDPGNLWLGIDPGTSGSCVAVGETPVDLHPVALDVGGTGEDCYIMPSLVYICREEDRQQEDIGQVVRDGRRIYFLCGHRAALFQTIAGERCFSSQKRLIGHEESRRVVLHDGWTVDLRGVDAVSMLVQYLVHQAKKVHPEARVNKAVVAVPNIFTPAKIEEMRESCKQAGLARVEHIYEAEATLMFYLLKTEELYPKNVASLVDLRQGGEMVLIVDFGGASVNVSYARVSASAPGNAPSAKTKIHVLQRVGYSIGGERIDWEIGKILRGFVERSVKQKGLPSFFDNPKSLTKRERTRQQEWIQRRSEFRAACELTKVQVSRGWPGNADVTINPLDGTVWSDVPCPISPRELVTQMKRVLEILREAVKDLRILCETRGEWAGVDTLLFSGRSSQFATVRDIVGEEVSRAPSRKPVVIDLSEKGYAKICVAMGAAYWGIQQPHIEFIRPRTFAHYGVGKVASLSQASQTFVPLISAGEEFQDDGTCVGTKKNAGFFNNGGTITFYQIMGSDPQRVLKDRQQHKLSVIAKVPVDSSKTDPVDLKMVITTKDTCEIEVFCVGQKHVTRGPIQVGDMLDDQHESIFWIEFP